MEWTRFLCQGRMCTEKHAGQREQADNANDRPRSGQCLGSHSGSHLPISLVTMKSTGSPLQSGSDRNGHQMIAGYKQVVRNGPRTRAAFIGKRPSGP